MAKNSPGSLFQPTLQSEKKPEGQKKSFFFQGPLNTTIIVKKTQYVNLRLQSPLKSKITVFKCSKN